MEGEVGCDREVLLSQLTHLNSRVSVYVVRLWQIPFAFLAIVCVAISQFGGIEEDIYVHSIGAVLLITGIVIIRIISNHLKRVDQLIHLVHKIEVELGLDESMVRQKVYPYYCLIMVCCLAIGVVIYLR